MAGLALSRLVRPGKFALVGLINTVIAIAVMGLLLRAGFGDYAANIAGYACGLANSFFLNRRFTFRQRAGTATTAEASRFLIAVAISYIANLTVLTLLRQAGLSGTILAHLPAVVVYTGTFYLLSSRYVFSERP